jgi:hypothetical protein
LTELRFARRDRWRYSSMADIDQHGRRGLFCETCGVTTRSRGWLRDIRTQRRLEQVGDLDIGIISLIDPVSGCAPPLA